MISDRRNFLLGSLRTAGLVAFGGLIWSAFIDEATATQLLLRPPGALDEEEFLKTCIKCGMCVEACPYDTLVLAKPGDNKPLGTPYFIPRDIPCYMCPDIPCVPICPSDALDSKKVTKNGKLDINSSKMGIAVVDDKNCIAFWGIQCDACYRICPLLDKAIYLEYTKNERTGKHAFLKPIVDSDYCTGCGLCERACVTEKAAIFVLPTQLALGKVGPHYIKGWEQSDEKRIGEAKGGAKDSTNQNSAIDSLNDLEGVLDD